ncbi:MAG: peptide deformylase, partial [Verrucomicrobia bacterium]|nr:peptide deformylase [Verrucomicrobiota bacterium]
KTVRHEEGCLSFPGIRGDVDRPDALEMSFQDLNGGKHLLRASGWFARVIQHEYDHLQGILFIDRMGPRTRKSIETAVKRLKNAALADRPEDT